MYIIYYCIIYLYCIIIRGIAADVVRNIILLSKRLGTLFGVVTYITIIILYDTTTVVNSSIRV